ncbi:MAG TPA: ribosome maturation factor [Flavisolibacter sp.]|jgi:ribosome maturation factor RimP|nr:ribosome maturation factor [Flavisolibacter sp.]
MQTETLIQAIEERMKVLMESHPTHFIVEIRIKPTNNIKVFIDADEGVSLSNLVEYNRKVYRQLEEAYFPEGNFSLEVSSPGLDEPLKMHRQYKKNVGRFVEVQLLDGTQKEGKLLEAAEDGILIEREEGKGKKKEIKQETVLFDQIKSTKIQIKF